MEGICSACLTGGRTLSSINETDYLVIYKNILEEISVSSWEAGVRVCWECLVVMRRWSRFKRDCQKAALHLMQHDLLSPPAPTQTLSRLQRHMVYSFSYNQRDDDKDYCDVNVLSVKSEPLERDDDMPVTFAHELLPPLDDVTNNDVKNHKLNDDDVTHNKDTSGKFLSNKVTKVRKGKVKGKVVRSKRKRINIIYDEDSSDDITEEVIPEEVIPEEVKPEEVIVEGVIRDDSSNYDLRDVWEDEPQVTQVDNTTKPKRKQKTKKKKDKSKTRKSVKKKIKELISFEDDSVSLVVEQNETDNVKIPVSAIAVLDVTVCEKCKRSFDTNEKLASHLCQIRKRKPKEQTGEPTDKPQCDICNKQFSSMKTYKYHMSTLHGGDGNHECEECGRRYRWRSNLARHTRTHKAMAAGELYCSVCDKRFASVSTFRTHLALSSKHIADHDKPCVCDECGARFVNKTRLRDHIDWEHLHKIKFRCSLCDKPFKSHTSMYIHMNNVHRNKGRKDYLCHICGKAYQNVCKLRSHVSACHTSTPAHRCSCGAAFTWHSSYYRHHRHCASKSPSKKSKIPSTQESNQEPLEPIPEQF